jgi:hypothetical protein
MIWIPTHANQDAEKASSMSTLIVHAWSRASAIDDELIELMPGRLSGPLLCRFARRPGGHDGWKRPNPAEAFELRGFGSCFFLPSRALARWRALRSTDAGCEICHHAEPRCLFIFRAG